MGVWVYSGARKRSKWRNAVSCASEPKHLWKKPGCCGECQNGSRLPRKTFLDVSWRVFHHFFWALFCLKPTRNALFTPFLVQNGQVAVTKEVWTYFTRQKPILVPDGPRPQRKIFVDIFWRVFIIYGLYFAWNWPEMHFLRHFWVKISQMPQNWSFFALNLHKKCNSGRFWAK